MTVQAHSANTVSSRTVIPKGDRLLKLSRVRAAKNSDRHLAHTEELQNTDCLWLYIKTKYLKRPSLACLSLLAPLFFFPLEL